VTQQQSHDPSAAISRRFSKSIRGRGGKLNQRQRYILPVFHNLAQYCVRNL
jgi:hypothetical protein